MPFRLGDHHHGNLLAELGERRRQATATIPVENSKIRVPQIEVSELYIHASTLALRAPTGDLVLPQTGLWMARQSLARDCGTL